MAQEFVIKSEQIEDKINQLLPSQGGFAPGVDFSASTMVIPIVDLTETAEGSALRVDLQSSFSHASTTFNSVANTTTAVVNTTGYYRAFGTVSFFEPSSSFTGNGKIEVYDGSSAKTIYIAYGFQGSFDNFPFDFLVKLEAGDSIRAVSNSANVTISIATRQIADLAGNLTNP